MNGIDAALQMLWSPALTLMAQERALRFLLGTALHVSTISLPDVTTRDKISQAFPLCIA